MNFNVDKDSSLSALTKFSEGDRLYVKTEGNVRSIAVAKGLWEKFINYYVPSIFGKDVNTSVDLVKQIIIFEDLNYLRDECPPDIRCAVQVNRIYQCIMKGHISEESQLSVQAAINTTVDTLANKDSQKILNEMIIQGLISSSDCKGRLRNLKAASEALPQEFAVKAEMISRVEQNIKTENETLIAKKKQLEGSIYNMKGFELSVKIQEQMKIALPKYNATEGQKEKLKDLCLKLCLDCHTVSERKNLEKQIIEVMQEIKGKTSPIYVGSRNHSEATFKKVFQSVLEGVDTEAQGKKLSKKIQEKLSNKYLIDPKLGKDLDTVCQQLFAATTAKEQEVLEGKIFDIMQAMKQKSSFNLLSKNHSKEVYNEARKLMNGVESNEIVANRSEDLAALIVEGMNSFASEGEKMELSVLCQRYYSATEKNDQNEIMNLTGQIINHIQTIKSKAEDDCDSKFESGDAFKAAIDSMANHTPSAEMIRSTNELRAIEIQLKKNELQLEELKGSLSRYKNKVNMTLCQLRDTFARLNLYSDIKGILEDHNIAVNSRQHKELLEWCADYVTSLQTDIKKSEIKVHLQAAFPGLDNDDVLTKIDHAFKSTDEYYNSIKTVRPSEREGFPVEIDARENYFAAS